MKSMPYISKWLLAALLFGIAATSPAAALEPAAPRRALKCNSRVNPRLPQPDESRY